LKKILSRVELDVIPTMLKDFHNMEGSNTSNKTTINSFVKLDMIISSLETYAPKKMFSSNGATCSIGALRRFKWNYAK
jgi:hypothetical protein